MAEYHRHIDVDDVPEILRLAEDVRRAGEPQVLRRGGEDLAVILPLPRRSSRTRSRKTPTAADLEVFLSASGSWADVDTDKLIEDIYQTRRRSTRPTVEL